MTSSNSARPSGSSTATASTSSGHWRWPARTQRSSSLDLRRYERWLLDAANLARDRGVWIAAISDSVLSPLSALAQASFVVSAASAGPFDSHVGTLALLNLLVVDVAVARRDDATVRLDLLEAAWRDADALTDDGQ